MVVGPATEKSMSCEDVSIGATGDLVRDEPAARLPAGGNCREQITIAGGPPPISIHEGWTVKEAA